MKLLYAAAGLEAHAVEGHAASVSVPAPMPGHGRASSVLDWREVADFRDALTEYLQEIGRESASSRSPLE